MMTMGMWNDENGEKCLTKNTGATTFPPQFGGAAKGKRLNGQARRLTSPHLEVLCRTSTVAQQTSNSRRIVSAAFTNL